MLLPARIAQGVRDGSVTLAFRRWEQPRVRVGGTQLTSAGIVRFDAVEEVLDPADLTDDDARAAGFPALAALTRLLYPPAALRDAPLAGSRGSSGTVVEQGAEEGAEAQRGVSVVVPEERPGAQRGGSLTVPEERPGAQRPDASRRAGPRAGKGGDHVYRVRLSWVGEDPRIALRAQRPDAAELARVAGAVTRLDAGRRTGPWTRPILEWIRDHEGVISTELAALLGREVLPMKADIRRLKALGLTESLRVGYRLSPRGHAYLESLD
jgi:hypothetical protein